MRWTGNASILQGQWARWVPLVVLMAYATLLVIGTHLPPTGIQSVRFHLPIHFHFSDKLAHIVAYGGLTLLILLVWSIRRPLGLSPVLKVFWVGSICLGIASCGLLDECTQPFVGRQFDWFDWFADLIGMSAAILVAAIIPRLPQFNWLAFYAAR